MLITRSKSFVFVTIISRLFLWLAYLWIFRTACGFQENLATTRSGHRNRFSFQGFQEKCSFRFPSLCSGLGDDHSFSDPVIDALDLVPLLNGVACHAGTHRGHQALLSLVKKDQVAVTHQLLGRTNDDQSFSRRQRVEGKLFQKRNPRSQERPPLVHIAKSVEEARQQYELVEAAMLALSDNTWNLTYPPIYGRESNPLDTSTIERSDNDEWLLFPAESWSLEHILEAEQVMRTLIDTKNWANRDETKLWLMGLSQIGTLIDPEGVLPGILDEITGQVEIVRVRTLSTSSSKASYYFRLRTDKYPVLKLLKEKEQRIIKAGGKEFDKVVVEIQNEIEAVESQIRTGLAQHVLGVADIIDTGLDMLARLDVIFAKAAFGQKLNGVIPLVSKESTISVEKFIHPVLTMSDGFSFMARQGQTGHVVPVDLRLSSRQGQRALLISGPNGGGKTLSMKSFGLVCILAKIGVPITVADGTSRPQVGFFENILINVGDKQNVIAGESTWTSLMNSCARMMEKVRDQAQKSHLILLDELGSGTDPEAGGAVAQAILEEFISAPECLIVGTTHCPRLKTLSYESNDFACATVLLQIDGNDKFKKPTFRLEYGVIGESYALGAASRCTPSLPESVLSRASQLLIEKSSTDGRRDYIQALTSSMEVQLQRMQEERTKAEKFAQDSLMCRQAMLSLAASYETYIDRLDQRLDDCYRRLREDDAKDDLELIGDTIAELKLTKRHIKSQQDLLREKGLKLVPTWYGLSKGESVVIVASNSELDGTTVEVVADATSDDTLTATEVLVRASFAWGDAFSSGSDSSAVVKDVEDGTWIVQRHELAMWDYDSMWDDNNYDASLVQATSVSNSKQRLNSILSTIKSDKSPVPELGASSKGAKIKKSFLSARARKAASSTKKKK